MKKEFLAFFLLVFAAQISFAQAFELKAYSHLVEADRAEFLRYAKSIGLDTSYDATSNSLFATNDNCVYMKPLGEQNDNEDYELLLIVSTLDKANNKLIL